MFAFSGLYELVEKVWRNGQWVGFLVGLTVGCGLSINLFRHWWPSHLKDKCKALEEEVAFLRSEKTQLAERFEEVSEHLTTTQRHAADLDLRVKASREELDRLSAERDRLLGDLAVLRDKLARSEERLAESARSRTEIEAKFTTWLNRSVRKRWDQPVGQKAARWRSLQARTMPIISVINLKGGVGKTTLTANLGVTFARERGLRVLMIDLDYQGSLSSRCLAPQELQDARQGRRFVNDILRNGESDRTTAIFRNAIRLEDLDVGHAYLLATDQDGLDEVESQVMAHWLIGVSGDDVRFRLREALHSKAIQEEYDLVLLDCPPRLSTGCVNALAASDYALIPVMLEAMSSEATPRLLKWLKNFQGTFCPELAILGVVANRVRLHKGKPIQDQQALWTSLKDQCREAWGGDLRFFDESMIRQFATLDHRLAALSTEGEGVMKDLADKIWRELPAYARRQPSAVPPRPRPSAPGVRSQ
jgi:cellulose biosynthesis protein BcsQ